MASLPSPRRPCITQRGGPLCAPAPAGLRGSGGDSAPAPSVGHSAAAESSALGLGAICTAYKFLKAKGW